MRRRGETRGLPLIAAAALGLSGGCSVRVLAPSDRDAERATTRALEEEVARLRAENDELKAKLEGQAAQSSAVAPEVLENAPVAVRLVGGFGSATPNEPTADQLLLVVHIEPLDSRARFVQVTGWVDVTVVAFPTEMTNAASTVTATGALPEAARVIATSHLAPAALRDSLRSGLFGIYYALECPIPNQGLEGMSSIVVRVAFRDGFSDRRLDAIVTCPPIAGLLQPLRRSAE